MENLKDITKYIYELIVFGEGSAGISGPSLFELEYSAQIQVFEFWNYLHTWKLMDQKLFFLKSKGSFQ